MVNPQDALRYLKAKPFRPFRIKTGCGKFLDIGRPELVAVTGTELVIFTLLSEADGIFDRWETVALSDIERITDLDETFA
jgi:hypothetical protein